MRIGAAVRFNSLKSVLFAKFPRYALCDFFAPSPRGGSGTSVATDAPGSPKPTGGGYPPTPGATLPDPGGGIPPQPPRRPARRSNPPQIFRHAALTIAAQWVQPLHRWRGVANVPCLQQFDRWRWGRPGSGASTRVCVRTQARRRLRPSRAAAFLCFQFFPHSAPEK